MFLNKVLDKKDYISLLCAYLFGIGSGLYAYTFIIPKPEPQVIVLDKLQLQKDLKMLLIINSLIVNLMESHMQIKLAEEKLQN